jgi:hypothetical protein
VILLIIVISCSNKPLNLLALFIISRENYKDAFELISAISQAQLAHEKRTKTPDNFLCHV